MVNKDLTLDEYLAGRRELYTDMAQCTLQGREETVLYDSSTGWCPNLNPFCGETVQGVEIPLPSLQGFE